MQKFFVETDQIKNNTIELTGEDVKHITKVLRLHKQEEIIVCDKKQNISYQTKIIEIAKEKVICEIIDTIKQTNESQIQVTIFQGLPKADKLEYIIQKATELGVKRIVPVSMARSIVKVTEKEEEKKILRWQKIAESAAKQSQRDSIPEIAPIHKMEDIEKEIQEFDLFLVAYEEEKEHTLKQVLQSVKPCQKLRIGVVIGPEGGIEPEEIERFKQNKAIIITLGDRILRTETASLCILSNIIYELES